MKDVILANALASLGLGALVLRANPRRPINRAFAVAFTILSAWAFCLYKIYTWSPDADIAEKLFSLRINTLVAAWLPFALWSIKELIEGKTIATRRAAPWIGIAVALSGLSLTNSAFLPPAEGQLHIRRGTAYYIYIALELCAYFIVLAQASRALQKQSGIRQLELRLFLTTIVGLCVAGALLNGIGSYLNSFALKAFIFPLALVGLAIFAWSICVYRVLSAREIVIAIIHRAAGIAAGAAALLLLQRLLPSLIHQPAGLAAAASISFAAAFCIDRRMHIWLDRGGTRLLASMRLATTQTARNELGVHKLVETFEQLLEGWSATDTASVLYRDAPPPRGDRYKDVANWCDREMLRNHGWATPESLLRRRRERSPDQIGLCLAKCGVGLVIAVPPGPSPSLVVVVGRKLDEAPFTYPEIERLQNIAELMDNILTRARLTEQAAQKAKTEHLAMMSRGLAHDLKNLLTPVSSFLVHTEGRFPAESVEAEVHAAARHSVRVMSDYVREARFFADRLAPQFENCSLDKLCANVRDLAAARAASRGVTLQLIVDSGRSITVDSVLIQRALMNLLANAIEASPPDSGVILSVRTDPHRVIFEVTDHGSGISAENVTRIFEPYFTTKEFGDDVRGFGLGLTICQKIAALHGGTISVRSEVGQGSTFTMEVLASPHVGSPSPASPPFTGTAPFSRATAT